MKKKIYSYSMQGKRDDNEDKHEHIINIDGLDTNINSINFFAVFDGHGGRKVSEFLKKNLSKYYTNKINKNMYSKLDIVSKYTNQVFDKLQNKLIKKHPRISQTCGSTACVGVQFKNDLWIFNVGDSRAIKCNKSNIAEQLTLDHKPNNPIEKTRIEQHGGKIVSGVSSKLNYLVVGDDAGSKLEKAKKINTIKIITENEFLELVNL